MSLHLNDEDSDNVIVNIIDDEEAHTDKGKIKVLKYIHWNQDHDFLHRKYLPKLTILLQDKENLANTGH